MDMVITILQIAYLADHWPDNASRNVAEATIECLNTSFRVDLAKAVSISVSCTVTNHIQNPLAVRSGGLSMR